MTRAAPTIRPRSSSSRELTRPCPNNSTLEGVAVIPKIMTHALGTTVLTVLLFSAPALVHAQSSQYDKGTPPQHTAGVSQTGSYISTDLGTVNLSNGALHFKIPLGAVGGGGLRRSLPLTRKRPKWARGHHQDEQ